MASTVAPFPYAGEVFSLLAALIWACSLSTYKAFGEIVSSQILNMFKNAVALICLAIAVLITGATFPERPNEWFLLIASGVAGIAIGDTAYFASLRRIGAQLSSSLQCLAPPFSAGLAALILGENLTFNEAVGIAITVFGVAGLLWVKQLQTQQRVFDRPISRSILSAGLIFAILSASGQALGVVLTRGVMQNVDVFAGSVLRIAPAILGLALVRYIRRATRRDSSSERTFVSGLKAIYADRRAAIALTAAAFFGTFVGIVLMIAGVKYAKAGVAAALSSTYPIFIIPIARVVLREHVSWSMILMTLVSVAGIAYMFV